MMDFVKFNINMRLNPQDERAVICAACLAYSEDAVKYAEAHSIDGTVSVEGGGAI